MKPTPWRETGPVRKNMANVNLPAEQAYIGVARNLLGRMKNMMQVAGIPRHKRRVQMEDGTVIVVTSAFGQDEIEIESPVVTPVSEETPEQDEEEEKEEPYYPYLFVGARVVNGGRGWQICGSCTDLYGCHHVRNCTELCPRIVLTAWEPFDEDSGDSIVGTVVSNRRWYIPDEVWETGIGWRPVTEKDYPLMNPHQLVIGDDIDYFEGDFDAPHNKAWMPDQPVVQHTNNNLYQLGGPITWDPRRELDQPDAKLWEQVIILDPQDPVKHWNTSFPYHTALGDVGSFPIPNSKEWQLKGKVLGGIYTVKFMMYGPMCPNEAGYPDPVTIELEVRLGKPPGRTLTKVYRITTDTYQLLDRMITPYGFYGSFRDDWNGPNVHDQEWMQGALRIDVRNGLVSVKQPGDAKAIPRGFEPGVFDRGCTIRDCEPKCTQWITDVCLDVKLLFVKQRQQRYPGDPAYLLFGIYIGPYDHRAAVVARGAPCVDMTLVDGTTGYPFTYRGGGDVWCNPTCHVQQSEFTEWIPAEDIPTEGRALGIGWSDYWGSKLTPGLGNPTTQCFYPPGYACYEDYKLFCYGDPCLGVEGAAGDGSEASP